MYYIHECGNRNLRMVTYDKAWEPLTALQSVQLLRLQKMINNDNHSTGRFRHCTHDQRPRVGSRGFDCHQVSHSSWLIVSSGEICLVTLINEQQVQVSWKNYFHLSWSQLWLQLLHEAETIFSINRNNAHIVIGRFGAVESVLYQFASFLYFLCFYSNF